MTAKLQTHAQLNFKNELRRLKELSEDIEQFYESLSPRRAQELFLDRETLYTLEQDEKGEFELVGFQLRIIGGSGLKLYRVNDAVGDFDKGKYQYVDCSYADVLQMPWYHRKNKPEQDTSEEEEVKVEAVPEKKVSPIVITINGVREVKVRIGDFVLVNTGLAEFYAKEAGARVPTMQWMKVEGISWGTRTFMGHLYYTVGTGETPYREHHAVSFNAVTDHIIAETMQTDPREAEGIPFVYISNTDLTMFVGDYVYVEESYVDWDGELEMTHFLPQWVRVDSIGMDDHHIYGNVNLTDISGMDFTLLKRINPEKIEFVKKSGGGITHASNSQK